jgi:restriction system protein
MADINRRRTGELLRITFELLWDRPEGMQAKDILEAIAHKTTLSEYERGHYPSSPDAPRYHKIIRFATIVLVKAAWLVKVKGRWILTEEGRAAYKKNKDPEDFYKEAARLYYEWKRGLPKKEEEIEATDEKADKAVITFEEAEEKAWGQVQDYLQAMNPYEFQELVADLLRAMGYHVSWVSPPGKDKGVDIIANIDPLGTKQPRIKVQVKRRESAINVEGLRSFLSVLGADDVGLFVSASGFTGDALAEARSQERRKITLVDLQGFFDLWKEHYDKLTQDARQRFPLKPIYFLAPEE